jgi:formate hydrogenlyase subunit 3/multisubunit Na+/H+ antiporter MnhD subunit
MNNEFLGSLALAASILHTFNHTLFKGGLFLGAGSIQYATHTKDIEKLGGLIKKMPVTAVLVLCFSLAISAIVPFNGFVSEWLTYQSLFSIIIPGQTGVNIISILAIAALAMSGALAAACFVKLFGISFLGKPRSDFSLHAAEVPAPMNAGMGILAAFCLAIGLFPMIFLRVIDSVVSSISGTTVAGELHGGEPTRGFAAAQGRGTVRARAREVPRPWPRNCSSRSRPATRFRSTTSSATRSTPSAARPSSP